MVRMYEKELAFAKSLADEARVIALKHYKAAPETDTKGDGSPVTIADKSINDMVIDWVKAAFPEHGILGEENSYEPARQTLWVCDPIDGTIGFAMGDPIFTFSIALVVDGVVVMAVVRNLENGDLFWATKGGGAYMNGQRCKVSERSFKDSWLAFTTSLNLFREYMPFYWALHQQVAQTNVIHGGVFKGMLVAQGLCDAFTHPGPTNAWDVATTKLMVEEAGGKVTDMSGAPGQYNQEVQGFVASNGVIHDDVLRVAREQGVV